VADCLETLEEIAQEGKQTFLSAGGKQFHYIACLNDRPDFIHALADLVARHLQGWPVARADRALREAEAEKSRAHARLLGAER